MNAKRKKKAAEKNSNEREIKINFQMENAC